MRRSVEPSIYIRLGSISKPYRFTISINTAPSCSSTKGRDAILQIYDTRRCYTSDGSNDPAVIALLSNILEPSIRHTVDSEKYCSSSKGIDPVLQIYATIWCYTSDASNDPAVVTLLSNISEPSLRLV